MAIRDAPRSSSLPPLGGANPFWSERIQGEHHLASLRPPGLPQKQQDGFGEEPLEDVESCPRTTRRTRSPGSDAVHQGDKRPRGAERDGKKTGSDKFEGTNRGKGVGSGDVGERDAEGSLERDLEREVVNRLWGENERLKEQLRKLSAEKAASQVQRDIPPPPPPLRTPERTPPMMTRIHPMVQKC